MLPKIDSFVQSLDFITITPERKAEIQPFVDYLQRKLVEHEPIKLNFICTHNSRRSQFSQLWAQVAAHRFNIPIESYSGGVEITAFNERAVASIKRFGFEVSGDNSSNPHYMVTYASDAQPLEMFSKLYDDEQNPSGGFAAIMTCSHADENCPYIPGCDKRIPVRYEDPKAFDDTPDEEKMYDKRSRQIATEMCYVFSKLEK